MEAGSGTEEPDIDPGTRVSRLPAQRLRQARQLFRQQIVKAVGIDRCS